MVFVFLCLTFGMIISRSVHVAAHGTSLFFVTEYVHTTCSVSIPLSMDIQLTHVLAIVSSAAMNIGMQVSF